MRRFYIHSKQIDTPDVYLSGREAHHLKAVLRLSPGDRVVLFDEKGSQYDARIASLESDRVELRIVGTRPSSKDPLVTLTVAQALLKKGKMDLLIRQLTELGVHHWQPFISSRSIPRPNQTKQLTQTQRWQTIAVEALKQCRRNRPPLVSPPITFDDLLAVSGEHSLRIILWEKATKSLRNRFPSPPLKDKLPIIIVLGPEGGFSEAEIEAAKKEGFVTASLGPRILRAETASLAASVLAMHHLGDLG